MCLPKPTVPANWSLNACPKAHWPSACAQTWGWTAGCTLSGAGLGPFFTPTGYGTRVAEGKEQRVVDGVGYILEQPLHGDFALIKAHLGDRWGNLTYRWAARNFNPVMSTAAKNTIAQVDRIVELGEIHPEHVMTPGIFVKSIVLAGAGNV